MDTFLSKNKYTLISMLIYSITVLSLGDLSIGNLIYLFVVLTTIPSLYNFRVHRYDKDPLWISIMSGLFFGIYLTPFGFGSFTGGPIKIIPYWVLLFSLNTFFILNRSSYRNRVKETLDKVKEEREEKIDKLLNPVKRKFFQ